MFFTVLEAGKFMMKALTGTIVPAKDSLAGFQRAVFCLCSHMVAEAGRQEGGERSEREAVGAAEEPLMLLL